MNNTPPIIDTGAEGKAPEFAPDPQAQTFVAPEPEKKKGNIGTIIFAILFVLALAGAGFLFITGMDKDSQIDSLTKKNKDLTSQLAAAGEKEEAAGDITGELFTEALKGHIVSVLTYKNGQDGVSEIMNMALNATDTPTGGFGRYYYRSEPGAEWKLVAEGQGVGDCLYYDEGVAAAFGDTLPCVAPAAEEGEDTEVTEPTEDEATEGTEEAKEGADNIVE